MSVRRGQGRGGTDLVAFADLDRDAEFVCDTITDIGQKNASEIADDRDMLCDENVGVDVDTQVSGVVDGAGTLYEARAGLSERHLENIIEKVGEIAHQNKDSEAGGGGVLVPDDDGVKKEFVFVEGGLEPLAQTVGDGYPLLQRAIQFCRRAVGRSDNMGEFVEMRRSTKRHDGSGL